MVALLATVCELTACTMVASVYFVLPLAPNDVDGSPVSRALVSQIWAIFVGVQLVCMALLALISRESLVRNPVIVETLRSQR